MTPDAMSLAGALADSDAVPDALPEGPAAGPAATPFAPVQIGGWDLPHRVVMAPLTRNRAGHDGVPTADMVEYYRQRASAGLIITEGTQPSAVGKGYLRTPGLHTDAQVAGWRAVADAVHEAGGRIVAQLMHAGVVGHPANNGGLTLVGPSDYTVPGQVMTADGPVDFLPARGLRAEELPAVRESFVDAAERAVAAGLDGVELHAANGYLLHQFLAATTNRRDDAYGGSAEARARFVTEVVDAVVAAIGPERVGMRISPAVDMRGMVEDDAADNLATYGAVVDAASSARLAFLHILGDPRDALITDLRERFTGSVVTNTGFGPVSTLDDVTSVLIGGLGDAVAVGRPWLANPDLVERWRSGWPLNEPDPDTYYGGDTRGYTDYPRYAG